MWSPGFLTARWSRVPSALFAGSEFVIFLGNKPMFATFFTLRVPWLAPFSVSGYLRILSRICSALCRKRCFLPWNKAGPRHVLGEVTEIHALF